MIGRSGERGSGISMLAARHDADDDNLTFDRTLKVLQLQVREDLGVMTMKRYSPFIKAPGSFVS